MNTKYSIVPSGKVARRMMLVNQMMANTEVELVIKELAALEQFDSEAFLATLPIPAQNAHTPQINRVLRYAYDCDFRMALGAKDHQEFATTAILAGLAANSGPVMLYYGMNYEGLYKVYEQALQRLDIDYQSMKPDDKPDLSKKCIIFSAKNYSHDTLKDTRSGVLVTSFDIEMQQYGFGTIDTNQALMLEFSQVIAGFSNRGKSTENWWNNKKFQTGMKALYPECKAMLRALSDNPALQSKLKQMGFVFTHPQQICRLMNICSDYIYA